ncbi:MAG TPA: hypothetical protein VFP22_01615 [Candidatus Limnocylindrales bacterium]|nr:hypothetical protein [Candidatus Limnocylindrales bacterium]
MRRAGHGRAADGSIVVWSLAEGRRGRRWREVVTTGEGIRSSLLLELDPDGRFSHLELSTPAGLLTLHPEGDGSLHGNAVRAGGIEHVRGLAWSAGRVVVLDGSAVCAAVAATTVGSPAVSTARGLRIGLDLALELGEVTIDPGNATDGGLPNLRDSSSWPLDEPA